MEKDILKYVPFVLPGDQISYPSRGMSDAGRFIIHRGEKKYFVKVLAYKNASKALNAFSKLSQQNIPFPKLIDWGIDKERNICFFVCEFINGGDLRENLDKLSSEQVYKIGLEIGGYDLKLAKAYTPESKTNLVQYLRRCYRMLKSTRKIYTEYRKTFEQIKSRYPSSVARVLLRRLHYRNTLESLFHCINEPFLFGYEDVIPANYIYADNKVYTLDCDSVGLLPFSKSLRSSILYSFFEDIMQGHRAFFSGVVNGFCHAVPQKVKWQLCYYSYTTFFERIVRDARNGNTEKLDKHVTNLYRYLCSRKGETALDASDFDWLDIDSKKAGRRKNRL